MTAPRATGKMYVSWWNELAGVGIIHQARHEDRPGRDWRFTRADVVGPQPRTGDPVVAELDPGGTRLLHVALITSNAGRSSGRGSRPQTAGWTPRRARGPVSIPAR